MSEAYDPIPAQLLAQGWTWQDGAYVSPPGHCPPSSYDPNLGMMTAADVECDMITDMLEKPATKSVVPLLVVGGLIYLATR